MSKIIKYMLMLLLINIHILYCKYKIIYNEILLNKLNEIFITVNIYILKKITLRPFNCKIFVCGQIVLRNLSLLGVNSAC